MHACILCTLERFQREIYLLQTVRVKTSFGRPTPGGSAAVQSHPARIGGDAVALPHPLLEGGYTGHEKTYSGDVDISPGLAETKRYQQFF